MLKRGAVLSLAGLFVAVGSIPAVAQQDQIWGRTGTPTRGNIKSMNANEVIMNSSGVDRTFQVNEIKKLAFADDPTELKTARDRVLGGQLEDAAAALGQLKAAGGWRQVVTQDIQFYKAYCQGRLAIAKGDVNGLKEAGKSMYGFYKQVGTNSYHYYEAAELLGDLFMALGQFQQAPNFYKALEASPWADYKMRGAVLGARANLASGKFPEALKQYQAITTATANDDESVRQQSIAKVGVAVCLAETGKAQQGLTVAMDIIQKGDPADTELFGNAYNAMGRCYRKMNKPKEALMAFLRTDILFFRSADAHAEALYNLSELWDSLNKAQRSREAQQILTSRYKGTIWANKLK